MPCLLRGGVSLSTMLVVYVAFLFRAIGTDCCCLGRRRSIPPPGKRGMGLRGIRALDLNMVMV